MFFQLSVYSLFLKLKEDSCHIVSQTYSRNYCRGSTFHPHLELYQHCIAFRFKAKCFQAQQSQPSQTSLMSMSQHSKALTEVLLSLSCMWMHQIVANLNIVHCFKLQSTIGSCTVTRYCSKNLTPLLFS